MKKFFYINILVLISVLPGLSQEASSTKIEVQKVFGGYNFFVGGEKLKLFQIVEMMESYQPAYEEMKSARTNYNLGMACSGIGGFMLGWQFGNIISGESPKWGMVALGTGIAAISIPLIKKGNKKAKSAVSLFNSSNEETSSFKQSIPRLNLYSDGAIIGLSLQVTLN